MVYSHCWRIRIPYREVLIADENGDTTSACRFPLTLVLYSPSLFFLPEFLEVMRGHWFLISICAVY